MYSCSGMTAAVIPVLDSGNCCSSRFVNATISEVACATVTLGARRPIAAHPVRASIALIQSFALKTSGTHTSGLLGIAESLRRDADHGVRVSVERDRLADDPAIGAEPSLPQPVAQHHDAAGRLRILVRRESAAQLRRDAEQTPERRADACRRTRARGRRRR